MAVAMGNGSVGSSVAGTRLCCVDVVEVCVEGFLEIRFLDFDSDVAEDDDTRPGLESRVAGIRIIRGGGSDGVGVVAEVDADELCTGESESAQVAKSWIFDPRLRNKEFVFFRSDEFDAGVDMPLRFSVADSVEELFARRRSGDGGGLLSVPGMYKSGFRRWAICLMNFIVASCRSSSLYVVTLFPASSAVSRIGKKFAT